MKKTTIVRQSMVRTMVPRRRSTNASIFAPCRLGWGQIKHLQVAVKDQRTAPAT